MGRAAFEGPGTLAQGKAIYNFRSYGRAAAGDRPHPELDKTCQVAALRGRGLVGRSLSASELLQQRADGFASWLGSSRNRHLGIARSIWGSTWLSSTRSYKWSPRRSHGSMTPFFQNQTSRTPELAIDVELVDAAARPR